MNFVKRLFRRVALTLVATFPGSVTSVSPEKEDDQNRIKHKDERLDALTRKTRMWVACFPKLSAEQRADPKVAEIMPWNGRGHLSDMADITRDQWDPQRIKELKESKG
jgi:hypothetical protein